MFVNMVPTSSYLKWTSEQAVGYINANNLSLARLRAIKADLGKQEEADRLETSIVRWIRYMKKKLKKDHDYEMP